MYNFFRLKGILTLGIVAIFLLSLGTAEAKKQPKPTVFPIGVMQEAKQERFSAALFCLKPFVIQGEEAALSPKQANIHIRANLQALANNKLGLEAGQPIPGLEVSYVLTKQETGERLEGKMLALTDEKGPYYGNNLKLPGMGTYKCEFTFARPGAEAAGPAAEAQPAVEAQPAQEAGRWDKPVQLTWIFRYIPRYKW